MMIKINNNDNDSNDNSNNIIMKKIKSTKLVMKPVSKYVCLTNVPALKYVPSI